MERRFASFVHYSSLFFLLLRSRYVVFCYGSVYLLRQQVIATVGVVPSCFQLSLIAKTLGIIGFLVDFFGVLFGLFFGAEENREKASPVLSSLFCVRKPLVRLALYALRLCFFFVVFFPLFRCWGVRRKKSVQVTWIGGGGGRQKRKERKQNCFFFCFIPLFYSFLNTFLRYCVTQYVKAQIKFKNA